MRSAVGRATDNGDSHFASSWARPCTMTLLAAHDLHLARGVWMAPMNEARQRREAHDMSVVESQKGLVLRSSSQPPRPPDPAQDHASDRSRLVQAGRILTTGVIIVDKHCGGASLQVEMVQQQQHVELGDTYTDVHVSLRPLQCCHRERRLCHGPTAAGRAEGRTSSACT